MLIKQHKKNRPFYVCGETKGDVPSVLCDNMKSVVNYFWQAPGRNAYAMGKRTYLHQQHVQRHARRTRLFFYI